MAENTVPTPITDKNGKRTTVHKKVEKARVPARVSAAPPPPIDTDYQEEHDKFALIESLVYQHEEGEITSRQLCDLLRPEMLGNTDLDKAVRSSIVRADLYRITYGEAAGEIIDLIEGNE